MSLIKLDLVNSKYTSKSNMNEINFIEIWLEKFQIRTIWVCHRYSLLVLHSFVGDAQSSIDAIR